MVKKALLEQQLRDLDGVGGSALADLVAAAPEVQTALVGQVLTNAADIDDVLIGRVERHGVDLVLEVVDELAARGVCDELLGTLDADLLLRAQHDGYAVAADDGHARAGTADLHLGQALLGYPEIIILDEPTVGLDPKQIIEIRELIKKLGENHTVILSSHILSEISAVCDHVFIISKGKLVASDATENLINLMSKNQEINLVLKSDEIGAREMLEKIVNVDKVTFEKSEEEKTVKAMVIAKANCDIREEIFELASAMHMPILEMHTVVKSLEDVFLELTGEGDEK